MKTFTRSYEVPNISPFSLLLKAGASKVGKINRQSLAVLMLSIERTYPHALYTRSPSGALVLTPSVASTPPVRWSSITNPHLPRTLSENAHPIEVTLNAGDTLYLPAGWWHHVRQGGAFGEVTISLNWWYDMEMRGMNWVLHSFLRGISEDEEGFGDD